ncbi:MAG: response regulator [Cyanobacteria bacterium J06573_11]
MRILLVDDDERLMQVLAERLIQQRYAVDIAVDGSSAQTYTDLFDYDLIVLDLMLPDGDGIRFCQEFRTAGYTNPLMILTARGSTAEKVRALDAGADDYVVKPFDFDELCARIRALLRRENQGLPTVLSWGLLRLDPSTCETTYQDRPIRLTPKEFSMMELFLRHPSRVYSLGTIIDDLWSFESPPSEDAVRTHIKGLRRKLKGVGAPKDLIQTVYGLGYRLNESAAGWPAGEKASTEKASTEKASIEKTSVEKASNGVGAPSLVNQSDENQTVLTGQLAAACQRYFRTASQQVATLEQALDAIAQNTLTSDLHQASHVSAHKLAGSLGSFGIAGGSQLARQVETQLQSIAPQQLVDDASVSQLRDWVLQLRERIDQATVQAATDAIAASVAEGTPVLLIVSEDETLAGQWVAAAAQTQLQTQVVTTLFQAAELFQLSEASDCVERTADNEASSVLEHPAALNEAVLPDIVLFDVTTPGLTPFLPLIQAVKQAYSLPVMVVGDALPLESRLSLVEQGVEVVTSREASAQQIVGAAVGLLKSGASQIQVAIADDDPQILMLLETSLAAWGFQVKTFDSALQLWRWMTASETTADVVVLDIEMPGMDGIELCRVLRADSRFQTIPILFLTQHQEDALRMRAFQSGADDFIDKAIAPSEIATRLRNQLARACRLQA